MYNNYSMFKVINHLGIEIDVYGIKNEIMPDYREYDRRRYREEIWFLIYEEGQWRYIKAESCYPKIGR